MSRYRSSSRKMKITKCVLYENRRYLKVTRFCEIDLLYKVHLVISTYFPISSAILNLAYVGSQLAITEVSRCSTKGGSHLMHIILASAMRIRLPTLAQRRHQKSKTGVPLAPT